jgi:hypothetical protein
MAAYTTVNKAIDHFNTITYTGNGSTNAKTGVGFQPDWLWIKCRSNANGGVLFDALRSTNSLSSNDTSAQADRSGDGFTSLDSDGFTMNGSGSGGNLNVNGRTYVAWNWNAAGATGSGTTTGSGTGKAYNYTVNTTAGFSIIKYKGNGTAGHTIPHHLGATPATIIVKRTSATNNWSVYHQKSFTSQAAPGVLYLNTTAGKANDVNVWGNSTVTINSTVFSLGDYEGSNYNDSDYIAYCFAEKRGYSKFGTYTGNGSADGTFIYTGFKPAFIMMKRTDSTGSWMMYDATRDPFNLTQKYLRADESDVEGTGSSNRIDILSNGVKLRATGSFENASGGTYVFWAWAASTLVDSTGNIVATAR